MTPGLSQVKPGLSLGRTQSVPGTNPGFLLIYTVEAWVCPWAQPSLSLGHPGRRAAQKVYMIRVYVPFSLAIEGIADKVWTFKAKS